MTTPLTDGEKERIRYHLGYMETSFGGNQAAASISFGIARPVQTMFLVEDAIQVLLTNLFAVDRVRSVLQTMDNLEQQIAAAACMLAAEQLGTMKLRSAKSGETFTDLLEREYVRWGYRLADILGVPVYAYSMRYRRGMYGGPTVSNVRIGNG